MEKEVIVKETKLKFSGVFDLDRLYKRLLEWLEVEGYGAPEKVEKSYVEKVTQGGKQIEVIFEGKKGEAGYFRREINAKIYAKRIQEVESTVDGNKIKLQKGDVDIQINSALAWNVNDEGKDVFPEASLSKRFYERFLVGEKLEDVKIDVYKDTVKFVEEMKQFLNLFQL